ncbi:MAG: hypothetical protein ACRD3E_13405 [Terriglobales bacterium]
MRASDPTFDVSPATDANDPSPKILALMSFAVSTLFLAHYYRYSQILLSGDAVAHINIARKVFDSRTPGLSQLGTVWLPLQHLLTIPFVVPTSMWTSGIGGAIPSMAGYIAGVIGIYRLVRDGLGSRPAAWVAAVIYGANPNLLYIQATALNEPLSMALFIWATVWFAEFERSAQCSVLSAQPTRTLTPHSTQHSALSTWPGGRSLVLCGVALLGEILIRYDGWFNGCAFAVAAAIVWLMAKQRGQSIREFRKPVTIFLILLAIGPAAWFGWNAAYFGDPLAFERGPYSAKAIEARSTRTGDPHHPGWHAPGVAALYFLRDAQLNLGAGRLLVGPPTRTAFAPTASPGRWQYAWLPVAAFGTLAILLWARAALPLLLLWLPLPFYALAIAWGGVPIFVPVWWPFSYYNTRYALELLPAFAVFWGAAAWAVMKIPTLSGQKQARQGWATHQHGAEGWASHGAMWCVVAVFPALLFTGYSYASIWRTVPICLREVRANGGARYALDAQLAEILRRLPNNVTILMYIGDHGGALERAAVPLRQTINEGNYRDWEAALKNPAASADYIVAADGDQVAEAVHQHPQGLAIVAVVEAPSQRPVRIYRPVAQLPQP